MEAPNGWNDVENLLHRLVGSFLAAGTPVDYFEISPALNAAASRWVLHLIEMGLPEKPKELELRRAILARLRYAHAFAFLCAETRPPLEGGEKMIRATVAGFLTALWEEAFHPMWIEFGTGRLRSPVDSKILPGQTTADAEIALKAPHGAVRLNRATTEWSRAIAELSRREMVQGHSGWKIAVQAVLDQVGLWRLDVSTYCITGPGFTPQRFALS